MMKHFGRALAATMSVCLSSIAWGQAALDFVGIRPEYFQHIRIQASDGFLQWQIRQLDGLFPDPVEFRIVEKKSFEFGSGNIFIPDIHPTILNSTLIVVETEPGKEMKLVVSNTYLGQKHLFQVFYSRETRQLANVIHLGATSTQGVCLSILRSEPWNNPSRRN